LLRYFCYRDLKKSYVQFLSHDAMFQNSYFTEAEHIIIVVIFIIITSICIFSSALVWIVVLSKPALKSPMNYLLLNLSLSDVVSAISVYPYLFILDPTTITTSTNGPSNLCIVTEGLTSFFIASAASLLTLCAISFNRFLAIKYPTHQSLRMGRKSVLIFSIIAWVIGTSCMVPGMVSFKWDDTMKVCARDWGPISSVPYRLSIMLFGLVLPTFFLILSCSAIYIKRREVLPFEEVNAHALWYRRTRFRKAEKMLGILILVYVLCWFPFIIYWLISSVSSYFSSDTREGVERGQRWLRITVMFCTLNGTLNPFIYTLGSTNLKTEMMQVARALWRKITCRKAYPIHPIEARRTISIRSNLVLTGKAQFLKDIARDKSASECPF